MTWIFIVGRAFQECRNAEPEQIREYAPTTPEIEIPRSGGFPANHQVGYQLNGHQHREFRTWPAR